VADEVTTAVRCDGPYHIIGPQELTAPVAPAVPPALVTDPGALALLIYASGTTGRPRGVMLDHANISATAQIIIGWFEMTADTRSLLVLPAFHVNGIMASVMSPLLAGGSAFLAERFNAAGFWATVERARPIFFSAVPTIYAMLTSRPGTQPGLAARAGLEPRGPQPGVPACAHRRAARRAAPADAP
jgi:long-chain acyl-CoA synthetase